MAKAKELVDYRFEENRLKSFSEWPVAYIDRDNLAAAGFYFSGEDDRVICFECKLALEAWKEGDIPEQEHKKWQADCRLMKKIPCGNVPIGGDPDTTPRFRRRRTPYDVQIREGASVDCVRNPRAGLRSMTINLGEETTKGKKPTFPEFQTYEARLKTFDTWPQGMPQTKESLAVAGFYYTGKGDNTLCHYCGGGLKDWEPTDDPWELHAIWFSKCTFLLTMKGPAYVKRVNFGPVPEPTLTEATVTHHPDFFQNRVSALERIRNLTDDLTRYLVMTPSKKRNSQKNHTPLQEPQLNLRAINAVANGNMCQSCRATNVMTIFFPCSHAIACLACSATMTRCMKCKETIHHKTHITIMHQYYREKDMLVVVPSISPE